MTNIENVKLYKGDCLEIMKDISSGSVDMILCDLPYGTTHNKWDTVIPFEPLWEQYNRVIKDNGVISLCCVEPFTATLIMSNIKNFKYKIVWEKSKATNFLNAKKQPLKNMKRLLYFIKNNQYITLNLPKEKHTIRVLEKTN